MAPDSAAERKAEAKAKLAVEEAKKAELANVASELANKAARLALETTKIEQEKAKLEQKQGQKKAHLENETTRLENKKAAEDLDSYEPTSSRLEGKVTIGDGTGLIASLLAHSMVAEGAEAVAKAVGSKVVGDPTIFITADRNLIESSWTALSIESNIKSAKDELQAAVESIESLTTEGQPSTYTYQLAPTVVGDAADIAGAAIDTLGWLNADFEIAAQEVEIGASSLLGSIAGYLIKEEKKVQVDGFAVLKNSPLLLLLAQATALKQHLNAKVKDLGNPDSDAKPVVEKAQAVTEAFDAMVLQISSASGESASPPILSALRREQILSADSSEKYVLYAGLESTGGEAISRRWFMVPGLHYLGGAQLTSMLLNVSTNELELAESRSMLGAVKYRLWRGGIKTRGSIDVAINTGKLGTFS
ncbi:MAG: hypothetical protein IPK93_11755 [Solirubrobacterales bacterium]|nr:hypothetical protein [Solirubrobacterales bacterium]